jgi:hypothetical protein
MSQTAPGPLPWNQRYADNFETVQSHLDGRQAEIHTAMPGIITKYDSKTMTATVQPAIQAIYSDVDGSKKPVTIATISDVPVHFPGGGGHLMTYPVAAGDECQLTFHERSIDFWHQHGGTQQPSDLRMHDINDATCHVGLRSQAKLPQGGANPSTVQLRSDDGRNYIELDGPNQRVNIVLGSNTISVDGSSGAITITSTNSITLDAPNINIGPNGTVTIQNRQFMGHEHSGVQRGLSNTFGVV